MEWNKEYQIPSALLSQHVKKTGNPSKKPKISKLNEMIIIFLTNETTSAASSLLTINEINKRSLNWSFLENKVTKNVNKVINPKPPTWIRSMTISWPAKVNSSPIPCLKLFKPVTQVALVAKNKGSIKLGAKWLSFLVKGMKRRSAPMKMITMNDKMTSKYGFNVFFWLFITDIFTPI